ncbi:MULTISPECIES: endonuclease/exonuclease/phosphatase family protein [unclassified Colwellia]|jgi:endonuclease/exonuclease/phosphatase family metal-dependent hydrolase|uniref:endonuclease/exonuclease/phosphatase family protein n=1 Tax=unclassified Colwellia TaxID=196834 RepID=UPI0015F356FC|nr:MULTISPECIES: endonuclease/exonuclease/phosphatase family protein [unclassified Colwellia]MBA6364318.1 endonuclease/exonuclease/phosphatase family protein [Colwellia sp. BRX8-8]MBA6338598.1 endonuclease/exonuclease/phosphatase family protein [Colwellia sp. BRX8-7]MBA6346559.1 endonuclease/exonuclease/phosphatase family protein [Colwellia sp. BRX8-9]MBA6353392.1 endonuclease/exonuclease/phosphatase family protein [Colwellia sp. BRX9-1]MBA6371282.1 endonuclease/exonuclease/phosphatase family |tara:strand:- start:2036 stop:2941 length:906 start_codon:yes stop_codon:yes gene_type:complete
MQKTILTTASLLFSLMYVSPSYSQELKVASWNIAWLGSHEYNKRKSDDYQQLAVYAKQLDADVIALQEVEDENWAKMVFGNEYDFYFSTKDWVQRVGVAVKKSAGLTVVAKEYKALNVTRVRHGMDLTLSRDGKQIRLLAVHLKSGCFALPLDSKYLAAMPSSTDKELRLKEACTTLSMQIDPLERWVDERAKDNEAFIVLGDFNRRFSQDVSHQYAEDQGLWQALDDEGNEALWTPTMTKESACWGGYYKDYIDHIVFNPSAKNMYIENSFEQLVFKEKYTRELANTLTDHCPISVKVQL